MITFFSPCHELLFPQKTRSYPKHNQKLPQAETWITSNKTMRFPTQETTKVMSGTIPTRTRNYPSKYHYHSLFVPWTTMRNTNNYLKPNQKLHVNLRILLPRRVCDWMALTTVAFLLLTITVTRCYWVIRLTVDTERAVIIATISMSTLWDFYLIRHYNVSQPGALATVGNVSQPAAKPMNKKPTHNTSAPAPVKTVY